MASGRATERWSPDLLRAALFCFNRYGWAGSTTSHMLGLRAYASVDPATLAIQIYLQAIRAYHAVLLTELGRTADLRTSIGRLLDAQLCWTIAHADEAEFLLATSTSVPLLAHLEEANDLQRELLEAIGNWQRGLVARGEMRALPPEITRVILLATGEQLARYWLDGSYKQGLLDNRETLAESITRALGNPSEMRARRSPR